MVHQRSRYGPGGRDERGGPDAESRAVPDDGRLVWEHGERDVREEGVAEQGDRLHGRTLAPRSQASFKRREL